MDKTGGLPRDWPEIGPNPPAGGLANEACIMHDIGAADL